VLLRDSHRHAVFLEGDIVLLLIYESQRLNDVLYAPIDLSQTKT
jgi:hypothetical protein